DAHHLVERAPAHVQRLGVILREVADAHVVPDGARAAVERELAGEQLEQRRLPRTVRSDQRDSRAALDGDVDAAVDLAIAVALARPFEPEGDATAARRLGQADLEGALVTVGRWQPLETLELLHATLHERGLGRLIAEARDERLDALDLLL